MKKNLLFIVLFVPLGLIGQPKTGTLTGKVVDEDTREPLVGANIFLRGTVIGTTSDVSGSFRLSSIPAGLYSVHFTFVGYRSKTMEGIVIREDTDQRIEVGLKSSPVESEQVVVTASRYEQNVHDVPAGISTVSAQAIADRVSLTLDEALRYVPGVYMMLDQVNIRGSTGYSRGVGSRVLVLFDGLPYTTGDTGEINWETFPMHQIERIEVVKGAGSALYGSNALGGVVNVITKEVPNETEVRWRVYSGVYDKPRFSQWDWSDKTRFKSGANVGVGGSQGVLRYDVSIFRLVDESYRENDVYHRWGLFTKLRYQLSTTQSVDLVANGVFRSHGNFFWWKSLSEATRPATPQRDGNVDSKRGNINFAYKEFITSDFFYTVKGIYFGNFWRDDSAGRVNNVSASHVFHGEVQAAYQTTPVNMLTFGASANYDQVNSGLFGNHPGVGAGFYLQDELKTADEWKWTLGVRFDWQRVSALPAGSQISPKIGLVYLPNEQMRLYFSAGAGFRYPSISELFTSVATGVSALSVAPNPNLQPERSVSLEIGASALVGENTMVDAAIFQNNYSDLIEASVDPSFVIKFNNVTKARIRGGELGIKSSWFEKSINIEASYTYTDSRDLDRETVLKFRPRHILYGSLGFRSGSLRFSIDGRFVSRVEEIDENLVRLAPIVNGDQRVPIKVVDGRVSYDFTELGAHLRIGFNVYNMLNYHYVELIGNLAPVRTYMVVLESIL